MSQKPKEVPTFRPGATPDEIIALTKRTHDKAPLGVQETDFQIARRLLFGLFGGFVDRLGLGRRTGVTDEKVAQKLAPVKEKVNRGANNLFWYLQERWNIDGAIQRAGERMADFFRNLGDRLIR